MKRRLISWLGVVAALALSVGLVATPGYADSPTICSKGSGTPPCPAGTGATGRWQSSPNNWYLCDIDADGHSVYIHAGWTTSGAQNGDIRFENFNGGCMTTSAVNTSGHATIYWRVCENIPSGPDECSSVRADNT